MADSGSADRGGFRGGFGGRGRGRGRGDRGRGRGRGGRGGRGKDEKEWIPVTKLGRLVKDGRIKSLEEIYLFSLPIKVRYFLPIFLSNFRKDYFNDEFQHDGLLTVRLMSTCVLNFIKSIHFVCYRSFD